MAYADATTASASTNLQDPIVKTTSSETNPEKVVTGVVNALTTVPTAVSVAEFSMGCNRKDTCRSFITNLVEAGIGTKALYANVVAVDFGVFTKVGEQAKVYNWVRGASPVPTSTNSPTTTAPVVVPSGAIRTLASTIAAGLLSALLILF